MMRNYLLSFILCMAAVCGHAKDLKLWYSQPAAYWTEALPVGNSRLGAMVYGGISQEVIQFNEETFWSGGPYSNNSPEALEALPEVRRLIFAGRNIEAQALLDSTFFKKPYGMRYLPAGNLRLNFNGTDEAYGYRRELDLQQATATTAYSAGGTGYRRTVFAPMGSGVIVVRIEADKPGALNFTATLDNKLEYATTAYGDCLRMTCNGVEQEYEYITSTRYTLTGLASGTYYYKVKAVNGESESEYSNEIEVILGSSAISSLHASALRAYATIGTIIMESETPCNATIYNAQGMPEAVVRVDGQAVYRPRQGGLYIVACGEAVFKLIVK